MTSWAPREARICLVKQTLRELLSISTIILRPLPGGHPWNIKQQMQLIFTLPTWRNSDVLVSSSSVSSGSTRLEPGLQTALGWKCPILESRGRGEHLSHSFRRHNPGIKSQLAWLRWWDHTAVFLLDGRWWAETLSLVCPVLSPLLAKIVVAGKGCMCVLSCFSHVWLFETPWTVAHQAPLSMEFSRQEYWSGLPFPSSRGSFWPRDQACVSYVSSIGRWEALEKGSLQMWLLENHSYWSSFPHLCLQVYIKIRKGKAKWSRSVVSDSLRPHGLYPTRLLCPWDFPGNSTGVDCHYIKTLNYYTL